MTTLHLLLCLGNNKCWCVKKWYLYLWKGKYDDDVSKASAKSVTSKYNKQTWASPCFRTLGHTISRETQNLQVPYFVDKNFDKAYRGASLRDLEKTIEKDYIDYIQTSCWKEKQQSKML